MGDQFYAFRLGGLINVIRVNTGNYDGQLSWYFEKSTGQAHVIIIGEGCNFTAKEVYQIRCMVGILLAKNQNSRKERTVESIK